MRLPLLVLAAVLGPAIMLASCASDSSDGDEPGGLRIVATIEPVAALAREVAGEDAAITVLVKAGVDPHEYELRTADRKAIDDADVILMNGRGIDAFLDPVIGSSGGGTRVAVVSDGVPAREADELHDHDDGGEADEHDHPDGDPHIWQSPVNAKIMVTNIADALAAADPDDAATYRANADTYNAHLDEVDREIAALIDTIPPANRKVVTNHDAFGYFLERYGLEFVGAVIPSLSTASEPSARDIADLIETIRREQVKAIFAESSVDPKVARQISADTGVAIVDDLYGDTLGPPGSGADTVDGMLLANAHKFVEALK